MSTSEHPPAGDRPGRRSSSRRTAVALAVASLAAGGLAGCSTSLPPSATDAPVLSVVTGLYPLAQAAQAIGGKKAAVTDVVPAGSDPFTWSPTPAQRATITAAGLVVQIGDGFQPGFESAATGAARVLTLRHALPGGSPYLWLDPATMGRAVTSMVGAMSAADPKAAALFRSNAEALQAQLSSLGIDYSSTLAACPGSTIVTPDAAFATMAGSYSLHDLQVAGDASPAAVRATVAAVRRVSAAAVLSQPWVDDTGVAAVARGAGVRLRRVDTLAGAPAGGWPRGSNYFALMEQNLGVISTGLGCTSDQ